MQNHICEIFKSLMLLVNIKSLSLCNPLLCVWLITSLFAVPWYLILHQKLINNCLKPCIYSTHLSYAQCCVVVRLRSGHANANSNAVISFSAVYLKTRTQSFALLLELIQSRFFESLVIEPI